jgi:preprotein translocase subunit Sec61beta
MDPQESVMHKKLTAPRAAAVAGVLFCILLITSQLLIWTSIPSAGRSAVNVLGHSKAISLALNLRPFAGIAFLWFIAVIRNRLGTLEDKFFATVFLGSGLLYIAMIFTSAALAGGLIRVLLSAPEILVNTASYALGRAQVYQTMNVFGIKMAGVFMFSTSTILLRTAIAPRWIAYLGYALGAMLLLAIETLVWIPVVFPLWIFLISMAILFEKPSSLQFQN